MKKTSLTPFASIFLMNCVLSWSAHGAGYGDSQQSKEHHAFNLGVCVGQTLAQQGINVPFGEPTNESIDDQTSAAIKAAVQSCRAEMGVAPEPSASVS